LTDPQEQPVIEQSTSYVGIDVAKAWLDVAVRPQGRTLHVTNDDVGWVELIRQLPVGPTLIALEASGGDEAGIVLALVAAGAAPAVVNPVSVRRFAQSLGQRAKTDRIDAAVLARYAEQMRPAVRPIPDETARTLAELVARREQLTKQLTQERNRRQQASALLRPQLETHIAQLRTHRAEIEALLASVVAADPAWAERVAALDTVPGFGILTATLVAVGVRELGSCTGKEAASLVGVAPYPKERGTGVRDRHISGGRGAVRAVLYEALTTTVRCNPTFNAHHQQLQARGKSYKEATIACVRRMLGILTAMLREHLVWAETRVGRGDFAPPPA
jgi:transposase